METFKSSLSTNQFMIVPSDNHVDFDIIMNKNSDMGLKTIATIPKFTYIEELQSYNLCSHYLNSSRKDQLLYTYYDVEYGDCVLESLTVDKEGNASKNEILRIKGDITNIYLGVYLCSRNMEDSKPFLYTVAGKKLDFYTPTGMNANEIEFYNNDQFQRSVLGVKLVYDGADVIHTCVKLPNLIGNYNSEFLVSNEFYSERANKTYHFNNSSSFISASEFLNLFTSSGIATRIRLNRSRYESQDRVKQLVKAVSNES